MLRLPKVNPAVHRAVFPIQPPDMASGELARSDTSANGIYGTVGPTFCPPKPGATAARAGVGAGAAGEGGEERGGAKSKRKRGGGGGGKSRKRGTGHKEDCACKVCNPGCAARVNS